MPNTQTAPVWEWDTRFELTETGTAAVRFLTASERLHALRFTDDAEAFLEAAGETARTAAAMWDAGLTLLDVLPLPADACPGCGYIVNCLCED